MSLMVRAMAAVASGASLCLFAAASAQTTEVTPAEIRRIVATGPFYDVCLKAMPDVADMKRRMTAVQRETISDAVYLGHLKNLLALDQLFSELEVRNLEVFAGLIFSPEASRDLGEGVGAGVYIIEADIKLGRLVFCGVSAGDTVEATMKRSLTDVLDRKEDFVVVAETGTAGEQTRWLNWNAGSGASGLFWVGLGVPSGSAAGQGNAIHLAAAGLVAPAQTD